MTIVTSALAAGTLLYLQSRFDAGDEKNALALVQSYRAKTSGRSLPEVITEQNPGAPPAEWSSRTESACFQHERVRADVTGHAGTTRYEFLVDINGPSIHPGNDNGHRALEALGP